MEVRKVGQSGEIICTSVLRAVNRSLCEEAPSSSHRRHRTRQTNSTQMALMALKVMPRRGNFIRRKYWSDLRTYQQTQEAQ